MFPPSAVDLDTTFGNIIQRLQATDTRYDNIWKLKFLKLDINLLSHSPSPFWHQVSLWRNLGKNNPNLDSIPTKMGWATEKPPMWSGCEEGSTCNIRALCLQIRVEDRAAPPRPPAPDTSRWASSRQSRRRRPSGWSRKGRAWCRTAAWTWSC